jgi:aryl-alcohol dehydrogenase-like predicted oxidoreductase
MKPISEIGFGAWQLGGTGTWGHMSKEEGITLVKQAIKEGVNFFDTAPGYGQGNSELILGEALLESRDKVFINTKVGHGPNGEYEFTVEGVSNSISRSLKNLQTNYLDSVILHNPERYILEGDSDLFDELNKFKEKGLIKGYGVSIDTLEELKLTLNNLNVDVIEIMFNIVHQEVKELFSEVVKKGILLIIKVPLDSGWLTGKYNSQSQFTGVRDRWSRQDISVRSEIVDKIKDIVGENNLVHTALRFILSFDAVTTVIPGTKNIHQLKTNCMASNDILALSKKEQLELLYKNYIKKANTPW